MTSKEFFAKSREIGPTIWLLTLYWAATDRRPESPPWFVVMDGEAIADEEVATFFGISTFTAVRWRRRLMKTGFVEAERCGSGYQIRVQRPPFAMAAIRSLREHSRAGTDWPQMQTEVVQ